MVAGGASVVLFVPSLGAAGGGCLWFLLLGLGQCWLCAVCRWFVFGCFLVVLCEALSWGLGVAVARVRSCGLSFGLPGMLPNCAVLRRGFWW